MKSCATMESASNDKEFGDIMLKFTMIEHKNGKIIYRYFPEGGTNFGIISFCEITGETSIINLAENDKHQRYALKMLKRLRKMEECAFFEKDGMIAWY